MEITRLSLLLGLLVVGTAGPAAGQPRQAHRLKCQGTFMGERAEIDGLHVYQAYNALGDGTVTFDGTLRTPTGTARLTYQDYTNLAPFEGALYVQSGPYRGNTYRVEVLDNTGGQFVLYEGTPSLGPPTEWGRFVCTWVPIKP